MSALSRIEITDFQSLRRVSIPLGLVTVITGDSNAGKSAMRRAAELVVFNAKGAGYVRRGSRFCAVALIEADGQVSRAVLIRRGARGTSGDFYRLRTRGPGGEAAPQEYTKLAGKVPEEISGVLRLGPVNFAGQFDPPFLLTETGTGVAQVLGELTNVAMVLAAAAEASRRGKAFARDAKSAQARLDGLRAQVQDYDGLPARLGAAERALALCGEIEADAARLARLRSLTARLETETAAAAEARQAAEAAEPPSLAPLEAGLARLRRLRELTGAYADADAAVAYWAGEAEAAAVREQAAHEAVHQALAAAGHCPMCGHQTARKADDADKRDVPGKATEGVPRGERAR